MTLDPSLAWYAGTLVAILLGLLVTVLIDNYRNPKQ